ncbi:uncharacterized protein [Euphorbia lathyris]|uniref:uncharacterized protein n=1 Tax=Euphorbia lathyris TaxID=212925 RepID=UPI0033140C5C
MNPGRAPSARSYDSPRGRSSPSSGRFQHRNRHMSGADGSYSDGSFSSRGGISRGRRENAYHMSPESRQTSSNPGPNMAWIRKPRDETFHTEGVKNNQHASSASGGDSKQFDCFEALDSAQSSAPFNSKERQVDETEVQSLSCSNSKVRQLDETKAHIDKPMVKRAVDPSTLHRNFSSKDINTVQIESHPSIHSDGADLPSREQCAKSVGSPGNPGHSDNLQAIKPFDICTPKTEGVVLNRPLRDINRQKRIDAKRGLEVQGEILKQGMVLLKGYLSVADQVRIVKQCRQLGLGVGGFYQPSYCSGAKLNLKMMCLGKNWDPNTSQYGECRPEDGAKPPLIPVEFRQLVERAMEDSRALVEKNSKGSNVENIIPWMSPDICIVNFYSASGRLGLHQDKDESEGSLKKGLPVVSFSIGGTGEFLYGDSRNADDAEKVMLESGDVLIFGGKSRHIFHGVHSVDPDKAPNLLLQETNLKPGRLNLTFRQY